VPHHAWLVPLERAELKVAEDDGVGVDQCPEAIGHERLGAVPAARRRIGYVEQAFRSDGPRENEAISISGNAPVDREALGDDCGIVLAFSGLGQLTNGDKRDGYEDPYEVLVHGIALERRSRGGRIVP
jgi:hypothetical protein